MEKVSKLKERVLVSWIFKNVEYGIRPEGKDELWLKRKPLNGVHFTIMYSQHPNCTHQ